MKQPIPFDFVLEELAELRPFTKPMFGCHALYVQDKIVLILRQRKNSVQDNGIWIATTVEHHQSLKKHFPSMRSITVFGTGTTGWQVLPENTVDFEESAFRLCKLIINNDPRVGKVPKPKKRTITPRQLTKHSRKNTFSHPETEYQK